MTGPEHYREAEAHLAVALDIETAAHDDSMSAWHQRQAQVHATLALAAASAPDMDTVRDIAREEIQAHSENEPHLYADGSSS